MSVPSELLLNTQNSFQTHAQRGANIVMRGGKRKSRRKKGGEDEPPTSVGDVKLEPQKKGIKQRLKTRGNKEEGEECTKTKFYGSQCKKGLFCKKYVYPHPKFDTTGWSGKGICTKTVPLNALVDMDGNIVGGKRKSKRTKRMARKSRRKSRSKSRRRKQQKGGRGRTITYANLDFMANNGLGKMVPHGDAYTNCSKTQTGGGGFGFTSQGANDAATFKGSYPAYQKYEKSKQCGGKRRRRRKSRKSKRKSRRKSRKSRRKRRKSRRRRRRSGGQKGGCGCKSKSLLMTQKGGSSHTYGAPFAGGDKPWATAPLGISKNPQSCYDNYNHFKGL